MKLFTRKCKASGDLSDAPPAVSTSESTGCCSQKMTDTPAVLIAPADPVDLGVGRVNDLEGETTPGNISLISEHLQESCDDPQTTSLPTPEKKSSEQCASKHTTNKPKLTCRCCGKTLTRPRASVRICAQCLPALTDRYAAYLMECQA